MKKGLRKKLHRGEFQEFGFGIVWRFTGTISAESNGLFPQALLDMIAASGLTFGGGGSLTEGSGFVCKAGRGSASEEGRSQVAGWFRDFRATMSATVGPLEDAWHEPSPNVTSVRDWIGRGGEVIALPPARR